MIKTLKDRYGKTLEEIRTDLNNTDIQVSDDGSVAYYRVYDYLSGEPINILCYDNFVPYDDLPTGHSIAQGLHLKDHGLQCCKLNLVNLDIEDWVKRVKTSNSISRGCRFHETGTINTTYEINSKESFEELLNSHRELLEIKDSHYSGFNSHYYLRGMYDILEHLNRTIVKVVHSKGVVLASSECLYDKFIFLLEDGTALAPFVVTTRDDYLLLRYKPYILSNIHSTRYVKELGCSQVEYGSYFDYKSVFNYETYWVRGLEVRS